MISPFSWIWKIRIMVGRLTAVLFLGILEVGKDNQQVFIFTSDKSITFVGIEQIRAVIGVHQVIESPSLKALSLLHNLSTWV